MERNKRNFSVFRTGPVRLIQFRGKQFDKSDASEYVGSHLLREREISHCTSKFNVNSEKRIVHERSLRLVEQLARSWET